MNALIPHDAGSAMRLAEMMSNAKTLPGHLQRNAGDCLMVVEQAMRWGMSPFAVAQCTSVIQGKLMFEGKLVAAALNSSGILARRLDYEFSGDGDARQVLVRGTLRGEDKPRELTVRLKDAKTNNQMWTKQPDQQLVYFSTRAWARRYAPEVMLGVYSPEEFDEAPAKPADTFQGTTIEAKPEVAQPTQPMQHPLDEPNGTKWLKNLDACLHQAHTEPEVVEVAGHPSVQTALEKAPLMIRQQVSDMLQDAYLRVRADDGANASEDGMEIGGEQWAAA